MQHTFQLGRGSDEPRNRRLRNSPTRSFACPPSFYVRPLGIFGVVRGREGRQRRDFPDAEGLRPFCHPLGLDEDKTREQRKTRRDELTRRPPVGSRPQAPPVRPRMIDAEDLQ